MGMSIKYPSKVPHQIFVTTLEAQQKQLKTDELMLRYAVSRERHSTDPYRPAHQFVSSGGEPERSERALLSGRNATTCSIRPILRKTRASTGATR